MRASRSLSWLLPCLVGCVDEATDRPPREHSLVDHRLWERVEGADDPWHADRPEDIETCGDTALIVEEWGDDVWLDLSTQRCAYVTVRQPLQADVPEGAEVSLRIWHFKLTEWEGIFHLAYQLGRSGPPEWSLEQEVPADSSLITDTWRASRDYAAGDDLYFHLANHGDNSWSLLELVATY